MASKGAGVCPRGLIVGRGGLGIIGRANRARVAGDRAVFARDSPGEAVGDLQVEEGAAGDPVFVFAAGVRNAGKHRQIDDLVKSFEVMAGQDGVEVAPRPFELRVGAPLQVGVVGVKRCAVTQLALWVAGEIGETERAEITCARE